MTIAHDVTAPALDQPVAAPPADLEAAWMRWHIARQRDLAVPHGWLSLTYLQWLDETPAALPGLPASSAPGVATVRWWPRSSWTSPTG